MLNTVFGKFHPNLLRNAKQFQGIKPSHFCKGAMSQLFIKNMQHLE
jgi:hypothetical protein